MHIQLLHTSASLAINENWDPDVRDDMEMMLNRIVPEDMPFRHSCEGPDDMVKFHKFNYQFNIIVSVSEANITTSIGSESPKNPKCRDKKSSTTIVDENCRKDKLSLHTPPRTPRISGLKSQILKPTFLS